MKLPQMTVGVGLIVIAGCNGQIANLGGNTGTASLSLLPSSVVASDTIASLTDAQASAVCSWILASHERADPTVTPSPIATTAYAAGYAGGGGFTCPINPDPRDADSQLTELSWPVLSEENCVLNLRSSPCTATLGQVAQCMDSMAAAFVQNFGSGATASSAAGRCDGCIPFESAAACDQTVVQGRYAAGGTLFYTCGESVPIEKGATCATDGGQ